MSAWVAEERNRTSGQALTESEERTFSYLVNQARAGELEEWEHFRVFSLAQPGDQSKDLVDTRWVLT